MNETSNTHWIPLSDLMMGLMMVFLLLATLYMLRVEQTTTLIVKEYEITKKNLKLALQDEFSENFKNLQISFFFNCAFLRNTAEHAAPYCCSAEPAISNPDFFWSSVVSVGFLTSGRTTFGFPSRFLPVSLQHQEG